MSLTSMSAESTDEVLITQSRSRAVRSGESFSAALSCSLNRVGQPLARVQEQ